MALVGMAFISGMNYVDADEVNIDVSYIGFYSSAVESSVFVTVAQSQNALSMGLDVIAAVKDRLENTHGMTVGILDTVRVFGLGVIEA